MAGNLCPGQLFRIMEGKNMSICPRLEIHLEKIKHNTKTLLTLCQEHNISVAGVTKVFCALPEITQAMADAGLKMFADSRIENLKKLENFHGMKILLRLPMQSQADEVVQYADTSLNSELSTIEILGKAAVSQNKIHNIILMVDLGDLREGVWTDQVENTVGQLLKIKGIKLLGLGTNLTCYGGVIPNKENLSLLVDLAEKLEEKFHIHLDIISGGNSSSLYLLGKGEMPKKINHLRLGESIVLGRETAYGEKIKNTYQDAFSLVAEIIELKEKPSVPLGEVGMDAFGNKPVFEDRGIRKRAIVAIGRQDVSLDNIKPQDEKVTILGASSDHLILDLTDSEKEYRVGSEIRFSVEYGALLHLMTSEYIYKEMK